MILLVFPHQLFAKHPGLALDPKLVVLIEDSLFFGDERYPASFHRQKLWLHRATMKRYQAMLQDKGLATEYIDYDSGQPMSADLLEPLVKASPGKQSKFCFVDPTDNVLDRRLRAACQELSVDFDVLPNPGFLNSPEENSKYRAGKKRWFMADFYKWQRRRFDLLMDGDEPAGGQWSYDEDNRKKIPKQLVADVPPLLSPRRDEIDSEARDYVEQRFAANPGNLNQLYYPTSHATAKRWLKHFLEHRLTRFGDYEDAIEEGQSWLWHSVLTPALNIGLLTPDEVVRATVRYADKHEVPLNSLEGFLRQVIGWREFMRATYEDLGTKMRTANHWRHQRPMPQSFYDATTGIAPVDDVIRRIHDTGYCHHIERLMVLGGFMFLCEIDPHEIYRWFMEMFVDSYDWVMVPNVYAMSQNADGGQITTKPYFTGSAYVRKMSHYKQGRWSEIWDGLYWRWIYRHGDELGKNPRWAMMCSAAKKMDASKRDKHLRTAEEFLARLE